MHTTIPSPGGGEGANESVPSAAEGSGPRVPAGLERSVGLTERVRSEQDELEKTVRFYGSMRAGREDKCMLCKEDEPGPLYSMWLGPIWKLVCRDCVNQIVFKGAMVLDGFDTDEIKGLRYEHGHL